MYMLMLDMGKSIYREKVLTSNKCKKRRKRSSFQHTKEVWQWPVQTHSSLWLNLQQWRWL